MSTTDLPLDDLVEAAVEDLVATAESDAGRWLIGELETRGTEAMWSAVLQLLRPLAARPAYDLPDREGAIRLRANAKVAEPATALVLEIRLALWEHGEDEARQLWDEAAPELRRTAVMHWLISYSWVIGHHGTTLTPPQTVSLIRRAIQRPEPGNTKG